MIYVCLAMCRLVCTALYNDGEGERKYLPQFFKFMVANPLSVRTKVSSPRLVKSNKKCWVFILFSPYSGKPTNPR